MSKIVLLDVSVMSFKAAFQFELMNKFKRGDEGLVLPAHYTYFSSIISCLKKINIEKDDIVILAVDSKSWRKEFASFYKSNRKEKRETHIIDWEKHFWHVNQINKQIAENTPFHVLSISRCEADDICAVAARYYVDRTVIIASIDSDLHQLCYYDNVKFFNLNFKTPKGKGGYIKISKEDALKLLHKKMIKGDVSDNILVASCEDENDALLRKTLVNLLEIPEDIESSIRNVFENLPSKPFVFGELPFPDSLGKRMKDIYNSDFKIDYDYCIALQDKRKERKKKEDKEKRRLKKEAALHDIRHEENIKTAN